MRSWLAALILTTLAAGCGDDADDVSLAEGLSPDAFRTIDGDILRSFDKANRAVALGNRRAFLRHAEDMLQVLDLRLDRVEERDGRPREELRVQLEQVRAELEALASADDWREPAAELTHELVALDGEVPR